MHGLLRIAAALGLAAFSFAAQAVAIDASDRGWYARDVNTDTYTANPANLNYLVGLGFPIPNTPTATRNYFAFDLSAYAGQTFASATLHLYNPKAGDPGNSSAFGGFFSAQPTETYELHQVTTNTASLLAGTAGSAGFFDLGDGAAYGSYTASLSDNGQFIDILLNAAGLADLNAAAGGTFVLGGILTTITPGGSQTIFGFSNANNLADTQLLVTTAAVPEPGTYALLLAGLVLVFFTTRRLNARRT
jgi:hypothetical protein